MSTFCLLDQFKSYLPKSRGNLFSIVLWGSFLVVAPLGTNEEAEGFIPWDVDVEVIIVTYELVLGDSVGWVCIHKSQQLSLQSLLCFATFLELLELCWVEVLV